MMNRYQALCRSSRRAFWFSLPAVLLLGSTAQGMYDPHHGRWFQRDPLGVRPDAPQGTIEVRRQYTDGAGLYEYVRSRPQIVGDPSGEAAPIIIVGGAAIVGAAACIVPIVVEMHLEKGWTNDKYAHCVASCRISKVCTREVAAVSGWGKELRDEIEKRLRNHGIGWDWADDAANLDGRRCAGWTAFVPGLVHWGAVWNSLFGDSCHCCCIKKKHCPN